MVAEFIKYTVVDSCGETQLVLENFNIIWFPRGCCKACQRNPPIYIVSPSDIFNPNRLIEVLNAYLAEACPTWLI